MVSYFELYSGTNQVKRKVLKIKYNARNGIRHGEKRRGWSAYALSAEMRHKFALRYTRLERQVDYIEPHKHKLAYHSVVYGLMIVKRIDTQE